MNAPCRDCEYKGCGSHHDSCPKYQEFKREQTDLAEKKHESWEIKHAISENIGRMKSKENKHKVIKTHKR